MLQGGEQGLGQGRDILYAVDQFAVGSPGWMGLSGCAYGGSLFHKYLECVGRGRKLGAILVIENGLTSANSGCNGFIFDELKRLRVAIMIRRFVWRRSLGNGTGCIGFCRRTA